MKTFNNFSQTGYAASITSYSSKYSTAKKPSNTSTESSQALSNRTFPLSKTTIVK